MNKIANKMRVQADAMTKQIEKKLNPATASQNSTPRRQRIIASMFEGGQRLAQTQNVLYNLADLIDQNKVPAPLRGVTCRCDVERFLFSFHEIYSDDFANQVFKAGHMQAIQMSGAEYYEARRRKMELYNKAIELIGQVPGYFPTPMSIVKRMIDWAGDIDDVVFDPSAGAGAILDGCNEYVPGVKTHGFEINCTLAQLCAEKGHEVYQGNIFHAPVTRQYKTILMNPPFENEGCHDHITFVYENWLAPGGTLVGITDSGAFSRSTKKAQAFRELVDQHGEWDALPVGSFKESKTGVNTCIVRLEK